MNRLSNNIRLESRNFQSLKYESGLSEMNDSWATQAIDKDIVNDCCELVFICLLNASDETGNILNVKTDSQLNKNFSTREKVFLNQNAPSFTQLFELSELRAQSQAKDTIIVKLKEQIKSLNGNVDDSTVKMDMDEIETLNIELEHRVTKLVVGMGI
ncbi:hypothetical protein Tco_1176173 [Tanacetum coccineum]